MRVSKRFFILLFASVIFMLCGLNATAENYTEKIIDNFDTLEGWQVIGKGLKVNSEKGFKGNCMCLDYSLNEQEPYVIISKEKSFKLPENYEFTFYVKGTGPDNNLEFKLIDEEGNTFWRKFDNFKFSNKWQKIVVSAYEIRFGWGPSPNKILTEVGKIEFAVSCGSGGKGKACIDDLSIAALPVPKSIIETLGDIKVEASSYTGEELSPPKALDGNIKTRWSSDASDPQWLMVDLGKKKAVEKIVLYWEAAYGKVYQIQGSNDGKNWYILSTITDGSAGQDVVSFRPVSVRFLRMFGMERGTSWGYSIFEFNPYLSSAQVISLSEFEKFDLTSTIEAMAESAKKAKKPIDYYKLKANVSPEGYYPKWINNKQAYWTVVGTEDSLRDSLITEGGMISSRTGGFSLMPYLYINNKLITAENANVTQALEEDYLPIPNVIWQYQAIKFDQKIFAYGKGNKLAIYIRYKLKNEGQKKTEGKLFLAIRPFSVNPPWMHCKEANIYSIKKDKKTGAVIINNEDSFMPLLKPDSFGAVAFQHGDIIDSIGKGKLPLEQNVSDKSGFASCALEYNFELSPQAEQEFLFVIPLNRKGKFGKISKKQFFANLKKTENLWQKDLNRIKIEIPEKELIDVMRSNLAYLLINKDGPSIQPGSRNYDKSWIRDGSVMVAALLRTGYFKEAKEYIEWVAKHQKKSGELHCILHTDGSIPNFCKDWIEWDGQGAFVFAVAEYYRFTKDKKFLKKIFPSVLKALEFLEELRAQMLTDEYKGTSCYGILPRSHSHEGYLGNPQQSLWDDYWALIGWKDAQVIAQALGKEDLIPWMKREEEGLRENLLKDIKLVQADKNIAYIPASIGLADFDPTSTAIAVWPCLEGQYLPQDELLYTLDKYYEKTFLPRLTEGLQSGYVPYELRTANAYTILGQKKKALKMIRYFLTDTRPRAWNHWAEVVLPGYRTPQYVGDMPHSWIGAIYINTIRNLFVYEERDKLILGAGIDEKWLSRQEGISISNFPTYDGDISYTIKKDGKSLKIKVWGKAGPKEGFVFKSPLKNKIKRVNLDGKQWLEFNGSEVKFEKLPAEIEVYYSK